MQFAYILALLPVLAFAEEGGHCTGKEATGVWGKSGICVKTSECTKYGGAYKTGACPDDVEDVKCCVVQVPPDADNGPCGKDSKCQWTDQPCSGKCIPGKCPGGQDYKCCLPNAYSTPRYFAA